MTVLQRPHHAEATRRSTRSGGRPARTPGPLGPIRHDIEGLRAVAVLLVVLYHAGVATFGGGYVGVDVFFVISGFLVTSILLREMGQTGRVAIGRFYARRAIRLLPAAAVVGVATVLGAYWWLPPLRFREISSDALAAISYVLNYRLADRGVDYLTDSTAPSPFLHFWSLAVEVQFYLVWPLVLALLALASRGQRSMYRPAVTVVVLAVLAWSYVASILVTDHSAPWAYFGTHTRSWELAAGALVAVFGERLARMPRPLALALGWIGLGTILATGLLLDAATPFPGYLAAIPVAGTAAVVAGGCAAPLRPLGHGVLTGVGMLSYSWYLWHWPALVILPVALDAELDLGQRLLIVGGALIAAMFTYVIVEEPIRGGRRLRAEPWRGIGVGLAMSATVAATVVALPADRLSDTGQVGSRATDLTSTPVRERELAELVAASIDRSRLPANLRPSLSTAARDFPELYRDGCDPALTSSDVARTCEYGDTESDTVMVLFGDSHAAQWFAALDRIGERRGWKLVVVTKSACSAADVLIEHKTLKRPFRECQRWREKAVDYIRELHPSVVVMSSNGDGGTIVDVDEARAVQNQAWRAGWVSTVEQLKAKKRKLYLINDTPWPAGNSPDCVSAHLDDIRPCGRPAKEAVPRRDRTALVDGAVRAEGVTVIDPVPWFCSDFCPPVVGNLLVYRDGSHLTDTYSEMLSPLLDERLN